MTVKLEFSVTAKRVDASAGGVEVRVHGVRQDVPPRMERIDYEILVDTAEPDQRLEEGTLRRAS